MSSTEADARSARLATEEWQSSTPRTSLFRGTGQSLREIVGQRELLNLLVRRELKARYKDSTLGFLWSLLRPLTTLVVYYVAIGKFLGAERNIPEFAIFIFTGLIGWQLFQESLTTGTASIVSNSGLVKKVYLPREVFPLAAVGAAIFNFLTQMVILWAAILVTRDIPSGSRLLFLPLSVLVLLVYGTAFGLMLAAVNVYLRDVQYLVEISMTVLFWASPIVYSWELVSGAIDSSWLENLYLSNPVTLAVLGLQRALWVAGTGEPTPDGLGTRLVIALGIGVVLLWLCQRLFNRLEGNFAQEL